MTTASRVQRAVRAARAAAQEFKRQIAGSAPPGPSDLEGRLQETSKKLKKTQRKLRKTRADRDRAHARLKTHLERSGAVQSPEIERVISQVRSDNLTYLKPTHLRDLAQVVADLETNGTRGLIVEAGTALGGSAIVMAAAKKAHRPMKVYDVFGMIPEPSERDGVDVHRRYEAILGGAAKGVGGEAYYGYRNDLYQEVTDSFSRFGVPLADHNVELVKGLFEDTIELVEPVAFAHLDGDWYESTMTCLIRIAPLLVPGGRIVLDDYYAWSGCRSAVDEYFADRDEFTFEKRSRLHVVRS